ncbi:unnamed protein product [Diatraea saccharalis]|uniref:NodB homology domain-containing protein n=1 Tax=Diatraea saccharalis TaxID=40085 RepID=A0A9N9WF55_9NEOP|nr:unnamed protein product [Diatraea saccharalis]
MKLTWLLVPLLLVNIVAAEDDENELPLAEPCDVEACKLPNCRCSSTAIPGGLRPRDTPQFVLVTFDDGVNILNIETYRSSLYGRTNANGCPAGATFYVSHEYTNYQLVNELYSNGFEIGLHSITHRTPQTFWAQADYSTLKKEFADQRVLMSHFANIPLDAIQGIRMPFLQLAGNASFQVLQSAGMTYDASWPTISFINPGLWPYTLDHASIQDCQLPPCPTASIEGVWVLPMISWRDLQNNPCAMADACFAPPPLDDEDAWFEFISTNFERHYFNNRAPFGFYVHEWYVRTFPGVYKALVRFLDTINNVPDVFMVNSAEVINWVKNPIPVNEYREQPCRQNQPSPCIPNNCGPLSSTHTEQQFWMGICNTCPNRYPWIENPLGL